MSWTAAPGDSRRRSRRWWLVAIVLLVGSVTSFGMGLRGDREPLAADPPSPSVSPSASATAAAAESVAATSAPVKPAVAKPAAVKPAAAGPATVASPVGARFAPLRLRIPAIGLALPVSTLGLNADGTVQVPTNFQRPGWFRPGPSPGQLGSAVILGHVDSYQGPAAFYRLRELRPGNLVNVTLADGSVAHFRVDRVATYLKSQFPARLVYGSHGYRGLQLVTCGGKFDRGSRSYKSNVVVYTSLVSTSPASNVRAG